MPLGGAIIMGSVALVTGVAGLVQKRNAANQQAGIAATNDLQNYQLGLAQIESGKGEQQGHDIASVVASASQAYGQIQAAQKSKTGTILIASALGLTVITAVLLLTHKKT